MESTVQPLSSTVRIVEWDDLPARVREIPAGFNPLDEGVLMAHQRENFQSLRLILLYVAQTLVEILL